MGNRCIYENGQQAEPSCVSYLLLVLIHVRYIDPDDYCRTVFNLKELADLYGVSLDILLETEKAGDINAVSKKTEQRADEFIWVRQNRDIPNAHRDLGSDLWEMWKGIISLKPVIRIYRNVKKGRKSSGLQ